MKKSKLVLFFTDKTYRRAGLKYLQMKFCTLPGIRHIISFWVGWRYVKKTQHMDSWEQYLARKNMEHKHEQFVFVSRLIRLLASITAEGEYRDDESFLNSKQELLECKLMNQEDFREFREYVEEITPDETDGTRVKAVLDSYTSSIGIAN